MGKRKRPRKEQLPEIQPSKPVKSQDAQVQHQILSRYYRRVTTLREYLLDRIPPTSKQRRRRIANLGMKQNPITVSNKPGTIPTPLDHQQDINCKENDLVQLLDSTLIGVNEDPNPAVTRERRQQYVTFTQSEERSFLISTDIGPMCPQSDIVDYVISSLFRRDYRPRHILAHGFERIYAGQLAAQDIGVLASSIPGLSMQFPNANVQTLKRTPWTELLGFLGNHGEDIMISLLLDCGIFICLDHKRSLYYQLCGKPLSNLEPIDRELEKSGTSTPAATNGKTGQKLANSTRHGHRGFLRKPNSIVFVRRRMFYARPVFNAKGEVRFGLKDSHVLNRYPDPGDISHTVHLMKYIFPRQFGLHNVFTSNVDSRETTQPFKDYLLREDEISKFENVSNGIDSLVNKAKVPRRLRGKAFELSRRLQRCHQRCPYNALIRHYCSTENLGPYKMTAPSQCNIGESSESQGRFLTQAITPRSLQGMRKSGGTSNLSGIQGCTNHCSQPEVSSGEADRGSSKQKNCFIDYATPSSSVSAFCRAVLTKVIPNAFFGVGQGGKDNRRLIMKQIDRFIRLSRYESLSLHEVCEGLKVTCIPWLEPPNLSLAEVQGEKRKLALSDLRKRMELLYEFVYYIIDSLLLPLIQSNFYVTESQVHRNRLFYFRHDVWRKLIEQPVADLKSSMFEEVGRETAHRILSKTDLTYSTLRLLPKATGVRPITNLRRRATRLVGTRRPGKVAHLLPSVNALLSPVSNMLNCEKRRQPDRLGSSLFSINDMHSRITEFMARIMQKADANTNRPKKLPRLYFVRVDIQSCFDTIPQSNVLKVIESLISEGEYHITKHMEIRPTNEIFKGRFSNSSASAVKLCRKFVTKAVPASNIIGTAQVITDVGTESTRRDTVIVDTSAGKNHAANSLMGLLKEHVQNSLIQIGKKFYRQRNGIPQGSVISSLLCNYFYGEMEQEVLHFLSHDQNLLLRFTDDFLLISTKSESALRFLEAMMAGQPKYGLTVNPTKSLVNFEATVNGIKMPRLGDSLLFPYCGTLIDTHTLSVRKDRDHLYKKGGELAISCRVSDTLTTESSKSPGQIFNRKILTFLRLQTQKINLDIELNTTQVVLLGIYTSFMETAMKMYSYIKLVGARARPSAKLIVQTIWDSIRYTVQATQAIHRKQYKNQKYVQTHSEGPEHMGQARRPLRPGLDGEQSVSRVQIEYLGAVAFSHILQRKQTQFVAVLRSLDNMKKSARPKTDREALRLKKVVRDGNAVFDGWRY